MITIKVEKLLALANCHAAIRKDLATKGRQEIHAQDGILGDVGYDKLPLHGLVEQPNIKY